MGFWQILKNFIKKLNFFLTKFLILVSFYLKISYFRSNLTQKSNFRSNLPQKSILWFKIWIKLSYLKKKWNFGKISNCCNIKNKLFPVIIRFLMTSLLVKFDSKESLSVWIDSQGCLFTQIIHILLKKLKKSQFLEKK